MKFKSKDGMEYIVYFKHYEVPYAKLHSHETMCTITEADTGINIDVRYACCSKKDAFQKFKGRKISFTRCLETFNKQDRAFIWPQFLKTCSGPWSD